MYTVEKSFILEAHKAAGSDWKAKLEAKFPSLFVKETYKVGDRFRIAGQEYILGKTLNALGAKNTAALISLSSGNIWSFGVEVDRPLSITKDEMIKIAGGEREFRKLTKISK